MLKNLRRICYIEGISCLLLFFVAMPVKYLLHEPRLVSVVGMIHGLLWVGLIFALFIERSQSKLSVKEAFIILTVSTFPLGMFWVDRHIEDIEKTLSS